MRLSEEEVGALPYPCALFDGTGQLIRKTPEWRGASLGALTFTAGTGSLVVAPDSSNPDVDGVVVELIAEILAAGSSLSHRDRLAVDMLVAALALVAGRSPLVSRAGTTSEVVAHAEEGIRRTVPGVQLTVVTEVEERVASAAAIGLGLVQLARNAARHAGAVELVLRVSRGPTFRVEWPGSAEVASVQTSRRPDQRARWGMGFTRLLADAVGGTVTAPLAVAPGVMGSAIGLGVPRFSAPVAAVVNGRVERATRAWDEETKLPPGSAIDARVGLAVDAALRRGGEIGYSDILRARATADRVWVGVAPQSSTGRARDVLRGIQHENALLTAAEPHATRIYAMSTIIAAAVTGEPLEAVPTSTWTRDFPAACVALAVDPGRPIGDDRLRYPDPRVAAFLLGALGGALAEDAVATGTALDPPVDLVVDPSRVDHPLLRLLAGRAGRVTLVA